MAYDPRLLNLVRRLWAAASRAPRQESVQERHEQRERLDQLGPSAPIQAEARQ